MFFFAADFTTGFSGVPAASALSFCFLVAIKITTSQAAASRTARPSFRSLGSSRAPVLRPQRPSARRSESLSWSHHRFCGRAALDGDVSQTITTGLKRHSVAHALPRSPSSLEQHRGSEGVSVGCCPLNAQSSAHRSRRLGGGGSSSDGRSRTVVRTGNVVLGQWWGSLVMAVRSRNGCRSAPLRPTPSRSATENDRASYPSRRRATPHPGPPSARFALARTPRPLLPPVPRI